MAMVPHPPLTCQVLVGYVLLISIYSCGGFGWDQNRSIGVNNRWGPPYSKSTSQSDDRLWHATWMKMGERPHTVGWLLYSNDASSSNTA
ncbi:hypothetical protein ACOSQ2_029570 [Xanthoceras sorbifolium]